MGQEEYRKEQREEKREEQRQEKTANSSRLGKEAKIGATVILLLSIVFGVVLVMRLMRSDADEQVASAVDRDSGKDRPARPADSDPLFREIKPRLHSGGGPTVVPARAAPIKPPKTFDNDRDKWRLASDKPEPKRTASHDLAPSLPPPTLPPTLPEPPKTASTNRYERYAADPPLGPELGGPKPLRASHEDVRLVPPDEEKRPRPAHADPPREHSRSERATALPPPAPPPPSAYPDVADRPLPAMPVVPVAQYGDNDNRRGDNEYRRDENNYRHSSTYESNEPRRPTPPSYGSLPPQRNDGKYEVQPNDSYWTISEKVYGVGAYFKALFEHNRGKNGGDDRLKPGDLILTPPIAQLEKSYPDLCPKPSRRETIQNRASTVSGRHQYRSGRTYTVAEGDTLFNIARYELGKASRWVEIYELNRDLLGKDFNYITPGIRLALPEGEKSDTVAEPPNRGYRR